MGSTSGPGIFVSYRRDDSGDATGRIADHLGQRFGDRVFLDVDSIRPGADFRSAVAGAIRHSAIVLVVVGAQWLAVTDAAGRRRIDGDDDVVRSEVEAALAARVPVVPVLVGGARLPAPADLPPSIVELATRNALEIRTTSFRRDIEPLLAAVETALATPVPGASSTPAQDLGIMPGRSAGGIMLGDSDHRVRRILGPAESTEYPRTDRSLLTVLLHPTRGMTVTLDNRSVCRIVLCRAEHGHPGFPGATAEGISVRSTRAEVHAVYGAPDVIDPSHRIETYRTLGLDVMYVSSDLPGLETTARVRWLAVTPARTAHGR